MRNWIYSNLDKVAHTSISAILVIVISWIFLSTTTGCTVLVSAVCGIIGTLLIGVLKEVADFMRGGSIDLKDMMADFVGSILGGFLVLLIL